MILIFVEKKFPFRKGTFVEKKFPFRKGTFFVREVEKLPTFNVYSKS